MLHKEDQIFYLLPKSYGKSRQFKMVAQEDPELPSSHRHNKSSATYETIPSEKNLRTS